MSDLTKQELDRIRDYTVSDTGLRLLDTIARLEGEVGRYGTELAIKLSTIARLDGELAASRADALERAAEHVPITRSADPDDPDWLISKGACSCGQLVADGVTLWDKLWGDHIRALITPAEAAARDERDRRIRLEEAEWFHAWHVCDYAEWAQPSKGYTCEACQRLESLRAPVHTKSIITADDLGIQYDDEGNAHYVKQPVPAERAGDAVCQRCGGSGHLQMHNPKPKDTDDCHDCHGTGKVKNDKS